MKKLQTPCSRFLWRTVTAAALAFMLAACGQTGPLYLPGPDEETGGMTVASMAANTVDSAAANPVDSRAADTVDSAPTIAPTPD